MDSGNTMTAQPSVLVIAGTDSSGGAGLGRDLVTLADHNVHACTAVTAVTAQTDAKVTAIHHIPPEIIAAQITAALSRPSVRAIKIGMLGTAATVEAVVQALKSARDIPIVIDPVLCSTSGTELLDKEGVEILCEELLPICRMITPNLPETSILSGLPMASEVAKTAVQARIIQKYGVPAVLVKGGHANAADTTDLLFDGPSSPVVFSSPRLDGSRRGTGCTLASAITANLANGLSLRQACEQAKTYLSEWFISDY